MGGKRVCRESAYGPDGRLLRDAAGVSPGDEVNVRLARGGFSAEVKKREE